MGPRKQKRFNKQFPSWRPAPPRGPTGAQALSWEHRTPLLPTFLQVLPWTLSHSRRDLPPWSFGAFPRSLEWAEFRPSTLARCLGLFPPLAGALLPGATPARSAELPASASALLAGCTPSSLVHLCPLMRGTGWSVTVGTVSSSPTRFRHVKGKSRAVGK